MRDQDRPAGHVFTTRPIVEGKDRVAVVIHNRGCGWLLLGSLRFAEADLVHVPLRRVLDHDESVRKAWPMRNGWIARRSARGGWVKKADAEATGQLVSIPARGFTLKVATRTRFGHRFCGEHSIPGAQCPNCRKPLLRMLTLDTADRRIGLQGLAVRNLHLLFCWTCNLAQGETAYQVLPDGGVRFVKHRRGGVARNFPYPNYPRFFPGCRFVPEPVPAAESRILGKLTSGELRSIDLRKADRHLATPRHQIGGQPYFLQGPPSAECPRCNGPMSFLASVGDETLDKAGFTGNSFVQVLFLLCRKDLIVTTLQQCD